MAKSQALEEVLNSKAAAEGIEPVKAKITVQVAINFILTPIKVFDIFDILDDTDKALDVAPVYIIRANGSESEKKSTISQIETIDFEGYQAFKRLFRKLTEKEQRSQEKAR